MHGILGIITKDLDGLGNFLELLFYNRPHGTKDVRTKHLKLGVTAFLRGQNSGANTVKMGHIIELIYNHHQSQPPTWSVTSHFHTKVHTPTYPMHVVAGEDGRHCRASAQRFSGESRPSDSGKPPVGSLATHNLVFAPRRLHSFYAPTPLYRYSPSPPFLYSTLSSWALVLVAKEARKQIGNLTKNDPTNLTDTTQLRASTNGHTANTVVANWEKLTENLSIPKVARRYEVHGRVPWYLTEMVSAPMKARAIVIQVGAISSFVLFCNRYASGYLALPLVVWQFACKSHVDEERVFSKFGLTVHDTTACACLDSLSVSGLTKLRKDVAEGVASGEMRWQYVLDNVQEWCRQRDLRLGRQDVLKVGCATTAILLKDCAPGAFVLQDHLDRVMKQECRDMTTESLWDDIDWDYIHELTALHWVHILVTFIPQLAHLRKEVEAALNSPRMTKLRLHYRKSVFQCLGINGEREVETPGMMRSVLDFEG
ncbi:hypothetical protein DFH07DRAFT_769737 [Mycena maculata]|uniref:DUF6589 domain-containing protein n=1 Tax=Mycena maculata TaxID=230809 RepID=A0AAD7NMI5_9AGAR|nr:hypothetical protein DFH07DRAFT_769737 [Mycena maculata]